MLFRVALSLAALAGLPLVDAVDPLVKLNYITYRGVARSTGVTEWLGIRYAAPPLGELRWRAPQAPLNNETVIEADTHGLICLSTPGTPGDPTTSEDCLYLDVYAPSNASSSSKLPVYLFIQGGGFNVDSNPNYNGTGLIQASEMNIVIVNFNYRVGLYGFLASQEVVDNGNTNVGLLDQRMVMQWVQQYISQFGGDPEHVVLGGDSAGGASILLHLTAYGGRDDGLFQAAAAESATFGNMLTISQSQYQYDAIIERVGCGYEVVEDTLGCLRSLNVSYLQANNYNVPYPNLGAGASAPIYMYQPTIDGGLITDYSYRLLQQGHFIKVPVIFGDDTNGGTIFTPKNTSSYQEMDQFLNDQFSAMTANQLLIMNAMYPPAETYPDSGPFWRTVSNAYGEMRFMCPSQAVGSAYNQFSAAGAWIYSYNVMDPLEMEGGYGVPHTIEINAIWGPYNVAPGSAPASYYPGQSNAAIIPIIQGYWTSFIRTYNPNIYRLAGSPEWVQWNAWAKDRLLFQTNATAMEIVDYGQQARCAYLQSIGVLTQQ
ncbi:alpha/beta-hydrolase [Dacryopinax primogenitus]|uniref:Carboxylic ester hydrolase n=1 Tax=Dacryopinax primogenitus (strain DJM 731) TaxID=1858805 RepID=M5G7Q5_DACPD|nr:alpha/beta-hydrolase [Dacryopinax primogenitus]EJU04779.1 alpha/beta-hydrolase [Dacryopinax primogenitus]